jgi:hypothetical protein
VRASRALPLAVMMTLLATALVVRTRRPVPPRPVAGNPSSVAPPASGSTLRGALPHEAARVSEHAARMVHGDAHHTHRAHGHGPKVAKLAWATAVGGPVEAQVVASPD